MAVGLWALVFLIFISTSPNQSSAPHVWLHYTVLGVTGVLTMLPLLYAGAMGASSRARWRYLWVAAAVVATAFVQSVADIAGFHASVLLFLPDPPETKWALAIRMNMVLYFWIYSLYGTAVVLVFVSLNARAAEQRLHQVQAAADRARLEALRLQINPHFLFNSLNAAVSLIGLGRSADAEAVLLRLSDLFRASLASPTDDVVPLEVEVEIVETYLQIELIRFGERLTVSFDLPEDLRNAAWPHFLLQPLAENAIKHGTACTTRPTSVSIVAARDGETLVVTVENDLAPAVGGAGRGGVGVGLKNIRDRLAVQFGDRAELQTFSEAGKFIARIRLPLTILQPG